MWGTTVVGLSKCSVKIFLFCYIWTESCVITLNGKVEQSVYNVYERYYLSMYYIIYQFEEKEAR